MMNAKLLLKLWRDRNGVAASEFALILPVLILLLFGTAELGYVLLLDKKITTGAQTAADLVAQQKTVSAGDVNNIFRAVDSILRPYSSGDATYTVASLVADDDGDVTIEWQRHRGGEDIEEFELPEGLLSENDSVIVALVTYSYSPVFGELIFEPFTITDLAYLRPRTTIAVEFSG